MPEDVSQPFNEDIERHGGYQYSLGGRRSTTYVNSHFSKVVRESVVMQGLRVLDVGCGDGTYTAELAGQAGAASVLGIDPASSAIQRARERYQGERNRLSFRNCVARDLVADREHFDVAIYRGVIHHVGDPAAEIAQGLRLAHTVFFLEPNGLNPVLKLIERFSPYHRAHRERSFRLGRYREWIREAGGQIERARYFGLVPIFSPDWMVSIGAVLEPLVEPAPGLRAVLCGQVGILARRAGDPA